MANDKNKKAPIKSSIRWRVQLLYLIMVVVGLGILAKILYIQKGPDGEALRQQGQDTSFELFRIEGTRGNIYSMNMEMIATSQKQYKIGIDFGCSGFDPEEWEKNRPILARQLSEMFGDKSAAKYEEMLRNGYKKFLNEKSRYMRITPRWMSLREKEQALTFAQLNLKPNIGGRVVEEEVIRQQPYNMAKRIIGRTQSELTTAQDPTNQSHSFNEVKPLYGLELSYDAYIKGDYGWQMKQKINRDFWAPIDSPHNVEPQDGNDIITTLDMDIQNIAEQKLAEQLKTMNVDWGCVAVMEVATGDLRAVANLTLKRDAQNPENNHCVEDKDYIISARYEPGSTFKLASLLSLFEYGGYELEDKVCTYGGRARIGRRPTPYEDTHPADSMTVLEMFAESSNIGFVASIREQFKDRPEVFINFLKGCGFYDPIEMGMPSEVRPEIWTPEDGIDHWQHDLTLNQMAYGYSLSISPMHTLMLYNAVANNGKMVRPRFVTAISQQGSVIERFPVTYVNQKICSDATIQKAQQCMHGVVDIGTGSALQNPYYSVAAKTGTARMMYDKNEEPNRDPNNPFLDQNGKMQYLATMVGYFPADTPKYTIIVCMRARAGRAKSIFGAALAGPVFKAIANRLYFKHTEWQPSVEYKIKNDTTYTAGAPAKLKSGRYSPAKIVAEELNAPLTNKDSVNAEWVSFDKKGENRYSPLKVASDKVPNVVGMGAKDALYLLESLGLKVKIEGVGTVYEQSIAAGSALDKCETIVLKLKR